MGVTEGTVKIRVEMVGDGTSATKAVKDVTDQADKATAKFKSLGEAAGVAAPKIKSVESAGQMAAKSLSGVTQSIIGGFVGAGAGGLLTALTDATSAVIDMVGEFLTSEPKIDSFSSQMIATANDAAKLSAQVTAIGVAAENATRQVVGMGAKTADVYARIARLNGNNELAAGLERKAQVLALDDTKDAIEAQMEAAERKANEAGKILRDTRGEVEKARLNVIASQEALKLRREQGLADEVQVSQLGLAVVAHNALAEKVAQTEFAYKQADGAIVEFAEHLGALDALQDTIANKPPPKAEVITKTARGGGLRLVTNEPITPFVEGDQEGAYIREGDPAAPIENMRDSKASAKGVKLAEMRDDALLLADAMRQVADATALATEQFPILGSALTEIQGVTNSLIEGKMSLTQALIAGGVAAVANTAKAIGGVRAEAAVRAAYEFGMGWATLENPVISAGHFLASGLLTAVAAGAGGAGGGATRGAAPVSSRSTRVSTASSLAEGGVVQNINAPWFGGLQEGSAYLYEVYQRAQGTGFAEAA